MTIAQTVLYLQIAVDAGRLELPKEKTGQWVNPSLAKAMISSKG